MEKTPAEQEIGPDSNYSCHDIHSKSHNVINDL